MLTVYPSYLAEAERAEVKNDRALQVIERVRRKLTGRDFKPDVVLGIKEQVEKLVEEATATENLCVAFLGWYVWLSYSTIFFRCLSIFILPLSCYCVRINRIRTRADENLLGARSGNPVFAICLMPYALSCVF